jgi:flagellar protein FlgJ
MTLSAADISGTLAADGAALDRIRAQAKSDPRGAVKAAAQQFEALLLNMLLKSMRETTSQKTPFDSDQTRLFQSMLDQQLAQVLAARGIGLSDMIARQLSASAAAAPETTPSEFPMLRLPETPPVPAAVPPSQPAPAAASPHVRQFVDSMWAHAAEAGRLTGIPPHFILGQAALESGWGRSEIRGVDGTRSHNLFGVKAGRGWSGPTVEAATTEYVNGEPRQSVQRFRAYPSYNEAFLDYARLLQVPRYAQVLERGKDAEGFATGLQQAGYATDPMYADKLLRIIRGSALRGGLAG